MLLTGCSASNLVSTSPGQPALPRPEMSRYGRWLGDAIQTGTPDGSRSEVRGGATRCTAGSCHRRTRRTGASRRGRGPRKPFRTGPRAERPGHEGRLPVRAAWAPRGQTTDAVPRCWRQTPAGNSGWRPRVHPLPMRRSSEGWCVTRGPGVSCRGPTIPLRGLLAIRPTADIHDRSTVLVRPEETHSMDPMPRRLLVVCHLRSRARESRRR
jgi:hypothetical protein